MVSLGKDFWQRCGPGLGALALLAGFAAFYYYPRAPIPFSEVEGTYSNPCCTPVRFSGGAIWFGSQRVPVKLANMKFGLVAETDRKIEVSGRQVIAIASTNPYGEMLGFDDDRQGFNLSDGQEEYHFTRQRD